MPENKTPVSRTASTSRTAGNPPVVPAALKKKLSALAAKYETKSFTDNDPSRVLRRYTATGDIETASFIGAMLAFGRRDQFLAKTDFILDTSDVYGGPVEWILSKKYSLVFNGKKTCADRKFYRFYSYEDMGKLFRALGKILEKEPAPGEFFKKEFMKMKDNQPQPVPLASVISSAFPDCPIVPQGKNTANKRINMFLRWMVRKNSPVDLGLWDWYDPASLVIPLDTHVLQEAERLGLIPPKSPGTLKTALYLTEVFRQIWPDDPCRGDFALFGLGVDTNPE